MDKFISEPRKAPHNAGTQLSDWSEMNRIGRSEARAAIEEMLAKDAPFLLGHKLKAMAGTEAMNDGRFVGFAHQLAAEIMRGCKRA